MKNRIILAIIFLCIVASPNTYSQLFGFPRPHNTTLINEERVSDEKSTLTRYYFRSKLSQEQILNFYRELFYNQGLKEINQAAAVEETRVAMVSLREWMNNPLPEQSKFLDDASFAMNTLQQWVDESQPEQLSFSFQSEDSPKSISLDFFSISSDEVYYGARIVENILRIVVFPLERFKKPQQLDFMPVYPNATEFKYETQFVPMVGVGYNTHDDEAKVKDFFLKQMPSFGWELATDEPHKGKYGFSDGLMLVNPFTKYLLMHPDAKLYEKLVPKLTIQGSTLTFKNGNKSCYIAVYTFPDALQVMKAVPIEMEPVVKYGNTLIAVYYFYDEKA